MTDHVVALGLGFGDEGKGAVVDTLCASTAVSAVVRYCGGSQAAHNVVLPDGRHHTFSQFGSGTLRGVPTHLSRFVLVNPLNLVLEAEHLHELTGQDPWRGLTIDGDALIVTPYHIAANRWRESQRGDGRHGSCGQGIGETQRLALEHPEIAIRMRDLLGWDPLTEKLINIKAVLEHELKVKFDTSVQVVGRALLDAVRPRTVVDGTYLGSLLDQGRCVFEGAQGVLLDEDYGFHPYTTWSTTTSRNAETLLTEHGHTARKLGITRSYQTRHGAGPFPTEDRRLIKPELHNALGEWQGAWRVGHLDLVLLRWAIFATGGVDELAVTHLDACSGVKIADCYADGNVYDLKLSAKPGFEIMGETTDLLLNLNPEHIGYFRPRSPDNLVDLLEATAGAPVTLASYGPTSKDKRMAVTV